MPAALTHHLGKIASDIKKNWFFGVTVAYFYAFYLFLSKAMEDSALSNGEVTFVVFYATSPVVWIALVFCLSMTPGFKPPYNDSLDREANDKIQNDFMANASTKLKLTLAPVTLWYYLGRWLITR